MGAVAKTTEQNIMLSRVTKGALSRSQTGLRAATARAARNSSTAKIIYTKTDEAPALATYSLLPIVQAFVKPSGVQMDLADISVAGRIIAHFPERLTPEQRQRDELTELGEIAKTPEANIVKLPNVSASQPQLTAAIAELQQHGYDIPNFPADPSTEEEKAIHATYSKILGSAVNPVLREGNSDRRVAGPVKAFAQKNPHKLGAWTADCPTHVAHMSDNDFFSSEQSALMPAADVLKIEHVGSDGTVTVLKEGNAMEAGEIVDASMMNIAAFREFVEAELQDAKQNDILLSLHLKATMMKVSDPIMFGHVVKVFYKDVFEKHAAKFEALGVNANNGVGDVYAKIQGDPQQAEIEADLMAVYETRPRISMVDSRKGITNLHVPSDVIIDASMPNVIRDSGCMWGWDDKLHPTKAIVPDRSYATMYQKMVEFCKQNGAFDVATMGNVSNVGLMAKKAEEYGSHPYTFEIPADGSMRVVNSAGEAVLSHEVQQGDIWRMCHTKDAPIKDWVKLAVSRARATGDKTIFWLNPARGHDSEIIKKVEAYLQEHDTAGLDIDIMKPDDAIWESMERAKKGKNTISVTGNVLRDYLTDLFPIIELGTSAKMLSIVPMLAGGGMYETGAGGSAPKHVQQFVEEGHLRWDSLGEFLALQVSLEDLGNKTNNSEALVLAETLGQAVSGVLDNGHSPSRKKGELGNSGSHYYLAKYWAAALAEQKSNPEMASRFSSLAKTLSEKEDVIVKELLSTEGNPQDIGGYFQPCDEKATKAMRPSPTLNAAIDNLA